MHQKEKCPATVPTRPCGRSRSSPSPSTVTLRKPRAERRTAAPTITPEEDGYASFKVPHEYVHKHDPKVGGYYVVYEDGYKSWSPAQAFAEGYTRL